MIILAELFRCINSSKLILFNHDPTGILEMFALNKPTCLWESGHHHQNKFVIEDYEMLKNLKYCLIIMKITSTFVRNMG